MILRPGEKLKFIVEVNFQHNGIALHGGIFDQFDRARAVLTNAEFTDQDPDSYVYASARLFLGREAAEELMNSLWQCGIRPQQAAGSIGQLAAVQKHLEDMRAIVFDKIEVEIEVDKP